MPAPWTGLGLSIHEAFCQWEQTDREEDVLELFLSYYDAWVEKSLEQQPDMSWWVLPPPGKDVKKAIKTYRDRGLERDVPTYRDRCLEADWEIYTFEDGTKALELEFEYDFSGVTIRGYIDRVQWWPTRGYAAIEDLKSGNLEPYDTRQLKTYSFVASKLWDIPINYSRYWYTKTDQPSAWVDVRDLDKLEEYLTESFRVTDELINNNLLLPSPGKQCDLCSVKPWCRELGTERI